MLTAPVASLLAALMLQQAAGMISWNPPIEPDPGAPAATPAAPAVVLPDWALADPFAWERSQCSPMIRKDPSLDLCQARVRTDLAAALGDKLPPALAPEGIEGCRQVTNPAGGYVLTCAPVRREMSGGVAPVAEVCEDRPTATAGGAVSFERRCTPAAGPAPQDGLRFKLGGD